MAQNSGDEPIENNSDGLRRVVAKDDIFSEKNNKCGAFDTQFVFVKRNRILP